MSTLSICIGQPTDKRVRFSKHIHFLGKTNSIMGEEWIYLTMYERPDGPRYPAHMSTEEDILEMGGILVIGKNDVNFIPDKTWRKAATIFESNGHEESPVYGITMVVVNDDVYDKLARPEYFAQWIGVHYPTRVVYRSILPVGANNRLGNHIRVVNRSSLKDHAHYAREIVTHSTTLFI